MAEMVVRYPDEMLRREDKSREELEGELRFQFAARMYEAGEFSLGQAAESLGMNRLQFIDALGRAKIPLIDFDASEIESELSGARGNHRRG